MNIFYKICVILIIIGGINWGLIGLFSFDAVAWLLGGSASLLSRAVYTVVGIAALCAIPSLFGSEPQAPGGITPRAFSLSSGRPVRRVHKTRFRAAPLHGSGPPLPFFVVPISPKAPPGRDFQSISCAAHFTETPLLVYNML